MVKNIIVGLLLISGVAFAEPSFQQIQSLIERQQYSAAEQGLEEIIKNHPQSAKAFYSMAQAQAGMGRLDKARYALDKARGLDPDLKFATKSNIESLEQAITPQAKKIQVVETSSFWHNVGILLIVALIIAIAWYAWTLYSIKKPDLSDGTFGGSTPPKDPDSPNGRTITQRNPSVAPATVIGKTPVAPVTPVGTGYNTQPAAVNNYYGSNNDGLLTGLVVGNMLSSHHHDTVVVQQSAPVLAEQRIFASDDESMLRAHMAMNRLYASETQSVQSDRKSYSWDSDSSSSKSSSWDSDSSTKSSGWDSDSSSKSSSWDSGSSSSSSWDSGSGSSDSSSSGSSDW